MSKIPVIELRRVSTEEQASQFRTGLDRQKTSNASTAINHNLKIIKVIQIIDVSGTSVLLSPEFQDLMGTIKSDLIQGVIVAHIDRIFRPDNYEDFAILTGFANTNTKIYTPDSVIDLNTDTGFLLGGIQSIMAGLDRRQIKSRMWQGKEEKRKQGYCPQSRITWPTGVSYDKEKEKYYYNEYSSKVKQAFDILLKENITNFKEISRRTGIQDRTLANIFRNKIYIGIRRYDQKRGNEKYPSLDGRQSDKKKVMRDESEIFEVPAVGLTKPLISESDFNKVQQILSNKRNEYSARRQSSPRFTYSGYIYCKHCGNQYYSFSGRRTSGNRRDYYFCKSKHYTNKLNCKSVWLNRQKIEPIIDEYITKNLTNKSFLEKIVAYLQKGIGNSNQNSVKDCEFSLNRLAQQRKKILSIMDNPDFQIDEVQLKITVINKKITEAEKHLKELRNKAPDVKIPTEKEIQNVIEVLSGFEFLSVEQKRVILSKTIKTIYLNNYEVAYVTLLCL